MSCRDRGLLVFMLSKPPEWKFTKTALLNELQQDGERSIQSAMKKLQELGYLEITRESRNKGRIARSIWNVRDVPQLHNAVTVNGQSDAGEKRSPQLRYPSTENAVGYKEQIIKEAVPGLGAGGQPIGNIYFDTEAGEWRRKA